MTERVRHVVGNLTVDVVQYVFCLLYLTLNYFSHCFYSPIVYFINDNIILSLFFLLLHLHLHLYLYLHHSGEYYLGKVRKSETNHAVPSSVEST